jgi:hypothetical protein
MSAAFFLAAVIPFAAGGQELYEDRTHKFSLRVPKGWEQATNGPYLVRFFDKSYQAFLIVDVVEVDSEVKIDKAFARFIDDKNEEVKRSIPSFKVLQNQATTVSMYPCYHTIALYQSGPNNILMEIFYVPIKKRIFMLTTICPEEVAPRWAADFSMAVNSLTEIR